MISARKGKIRRVRDMLSRLQTENIEPDDSDMCLLHAYINSKFSLKDLITHAQQFSTVEDYRKWIYDSAFLDGDESKVATPSDQFFIEIEALMRRKHMSNKP